MKLRNKLICGVAAVAFLQLAGSSAFADLIGKTGGLDGLYQTGGGYSSGNGGEFTISGSDLDTTWYDPGVLISSGTFQTFCLEKGEFTFTGPGSYEVASAAFHGGVATSDRLSKGTTWLYSQFAKKQWDASIGYNYDAASGRGTSAGDLQNAIWMLEGELDWDISNGYIAAVVQKFTSQAGAQANALVGEYGVYALNITDASGGLAQDQLYYNVPDGGLTLMLFGMSLSGLAVLRRYKRA